MGSKWKIEKFTGSNDFGLWKVKMRALLTHNKCVEALKGVTQISATLSNAEKTEMDEKALSSIILCLGDKVLREVARETSTAQLAKFNKIIDDLTNVDVNLEDEDKAFHLLCVLPKSYENLKDALLYDKEGTITLDEVQSALRTKELTKFKDLKVDDGVEGLNVARSRSENGGKGKGNHGSKSRPGDGGGKFKCYYCQESGHFKKDCPRRRGGGSSSTQVAVSDEAYEEGYENAGALIVTSLEPYMVISLERRWKMVCPGKGSTGSRQSAAGLAGVLLRAPGADLLAPGAA
ncbi:hypothetical protein P8452_21220 [Trifolium repens]|nr:hypothetical protein P8452_21220 [Trifolium repens]